MPTPSWPLGGAGGITRYSITATINSDLTVTLDLSNYITDGPFDFDQKAPAWDSGTTYFYGDYVTGSDDQVYSSLADSNLGNDPISSPTWWTPQFRQDEECLLGIFNNSTSTINSISFDLGIGSNTAAFSFDGNGPDPGIGYRDTLQDYSGDLGPAPEDLPPGYVMSGYEGPDTYFGWIVAPLTLSYASQYPYVLGDGTIYFIGGLPPGGETYCGLEYTLSDGPVVVDAESTECAFAEDEDDAPQTPVAWPECDLVPSRIDLRMVSPTVSPGRSLTGFERVVQPDAGSWEITLEDIPIRNRSDVLRWRDIESRINGRANPVLVPVYEGKLSLTPIAATANADVAIGAVVIAIDKSAGATLRAGMQFSDLVGRMYRIKSIIGVSGSVTTVKVWPPVRTPITAGDALEFNKPVCLCRLASDGEMNSMLELLTFARQSVKFVENV